MSLAIRESNGPHSLSQNIPPQNIEAEQGVLGSILLDNYVLADVVMELSPEDFYREVHEILYRHIVSLYTASVPVDAVTLAHSLEKTGDLKRVGGEDYLADIINSVPHAAHAKSYAQIVRQKSVARDLIESATATLQECYSNMFTAEELLNNAEKRVFAVSSSGRKDEEITAEEAVRRALDRMDRRLFGATGMTSGLVALDAITDGFHPEQLIIVAGRPSMGKSAFAMNLAAHVSIDQRRPVMFYSVEMGHMELAERLMSFRGNIPANLFKKPANLDSGHMRQISQVYDSVKALPWKFNDVSAQTALSIAASARRMKQRCGDLGLVVVDYLQLLNPVDPRDSRQEQVALMSRAMKTLAREIKCPVVVLSQLNRKAEDREDRRPRMADLRESGAIEQDADIVILLHRPEYYDPNDQPGLAEMIVAKNRNGGTCTAEVAWSPSITRFLDLIVPGPDLGPTPGHAPADDILGDTRPKLLTNADPEDFTDGEF